jgi:hypothetical protein
MFLPIAFGSNRLMCRFINSNSQISFIVLSLIIRDFELSGEIHFPSTPGVYCVYLLFCNDEINDPGKNECKVHC